MVMYINIVLKTRMMLEDDKVDIWFTKPVHLSGTIMLRVSYTVPNT